MHAYGDPATWSRTDTRGDRSRFDPIDALESYRLATSPGAVNRHEQAECGYSRLRSRCASVETPMPRISEFYGILIYMYYSDHGPPHFHAMYGRFEAVVAIETAGTLRGSLPRRASSLVRE